MPGIQGDYLVGRFLEHDQVASVFADSWMHFVVAISMYAILELILILLSCWAFCSNCKPTRAF